MNYRFCLSCCLVFTMILNSCTTENNDQKRKELDIRKLKEQFIRANRHNLQKEKDIIEQYIRNHNQPYRYTPQGIYFYLIKPNEKSDSIRVGQTIKVEYKIYLLDGSLCYQSESGKPRTIIVENDQTESGIHRGLQMMRKGERARLIIPSYLAHGLLGDFDKIPPQSPIMADITVLDE